MLTTAQPTPVLFLNTRDAIGADVAVHLGLMRHLDRAKIAPSLISNSEATDAPQMRRLCEAIPDLPVRFANLGLPNTQFALLSKAAKVGSLAKLGATLLQVALEVRQKNIRVIHVTDRPRDAFFAAMLGKITGAASVVHMHSNCGAHLSRQTLYGLRNASAVFAVSEFIRQGLIAQGVSPDRVHCLYNATDAAVFDPHVHAAGKVETRSRFGIGADAFLIGTVARLIPWKGQRELIQAAAIVSESRPNLRILIVGTGPDREALQEFVAEYKMSDKVVFAGWHDEVAPLLAALDVFAMPSYEEPFGLAITEAMAMELPVIASSTGGVPEIITHGLDGWLVEPRSVPELVTAFSALASDASLRRVIGSAARHRVRDCFSPRAQADLATSFYTKLTTKRQP